MSYLIDTAVLLWSIFEQTEKLSSEARKVVSTSSDSLVLSAVCTWEISIKHSLGKLTISGDPESLIENLILEKNLQRLPISHAHTFATLRLPFHHKDPFDRLLIAQALEEDLPVITPDPHFKKYGVEVVW